MAHQLEIINNEASMAYAKSGGLPWHGLGIEVPNDLTDEQFMVKAGLNWEVQKIPNYYLHGTEKRKSKNSSLVRSSDGRELSSVSDGWNPVQNAEAFKFFRDFVNAGDMEMHTAGSLFDGKMIWVLAKIKEQFTVFGNDQVDSYLLFSNPHIYGKSVDIRFTPIRVVCNNTLTLSLSSKADLAVKLNHSRPFNTDLVKSALGVASSKLQTYQSMAEYLGSKRYTPDNVVQYFKEVFNHPDKMQKMSKPAEIAYSVLESQPGAQYAEGSWWQAANAVTYSIDHILGQSNATRLQSSWYGPNRLRKPKALELALSFADNS